MGTFKGGIALLDPSACPLPTQALSEKHTPIHFVAYRM